jgi:hypothetical protein
MDRRRGLVALGVGLVVSLAVVWAFFATLLPFAGPSIGHPWRGGVPFVAVSFAGFGLARRIEGSGRRIGVLVGLPGAAIGGVLGVLAALRTAHLLAVAGLVVVHLASASLGGWLGGRRGMVAGR